MSTIQEVDEYEARRWQHGGESRVIGLGGALAQTGLSHLFPLAVEVAILSVTFKLVTNVNVADRHPIVELFDGLGGLVFAVAPPNAQSAGQTVSYSFAPLVPAFGSAGLGAMGGPFVGARLPGNLELFIGVGNADAGDRITNATLLARQWPAHQDVLGGSASE